MFLMCFWLIKLVFRLLKTTVWRKLRWVKKKPNQCVSLQCLSTGCSIENLPAAKNWWRKVYSDPGQAWLIISCIATWKPVMWFVTEIGILQLTDSENYHIPANSFELYTKQETYSRCWDTSRCPTFVIDTITVHLWRPFVWYYFLTHLKRESHEIFDLWYFRPTSSTFFKLLPQRRRVVKLTLAYILFDCLFKENEGL